MEALTIVLVVLKLVGVIDWSWLWVLAPMWISFAFLIVIASWAALIGAVMGKFSQE